MSTLDTLKLIAIRIRVNAAEKDYVQRAAEAAALSVSNYVRRAIGLPELD